MLGITGRAETDPTVCATNFSPEDQGASAAVGLIVFEHRVDGAIRNGECSQSSPS